MPVLRVCLCLFVSPPRFYIMEWIHLTRVPLCASLIYTLSTGTWLGRQPCRHYFVGSVCSAPRHDVRCWGEERFSTPRHCVVLVNCRQRMRHRFACTFIVIYSVSNRRCVLPTPTPSNRCPMNTDCRCSTLWRASREKRTTRYAPETALYNTPRACGDHPLQEHHSPR